MKIGFDKNFFDSNLGSTTGFTLEGNNYVTTVNFGGSNTRVSADGSGKQD